MKTIQHQTTEACQVAIDSYNLLLGYPDANGTTSYADVPEPTQVIVTDEEGNETVVDTYYELSITEQLDRLLEPAAWEEIDRLEAERIANLPPYEEPPYVEPEPIDYTIEIEARKNELLLKLANAIVEVNSVKEAAREVVGSENTDFIWAVGQAEYIRAMSIQLINALDTLEAAMAFDVREHTVKAMKDLFIKFIIQ